MEYDRLPFPEAVEDLANRLGLTVPHEAGSAAAASATGGGAAGSDDTGPLYELLAKVADFYCSVLQRSERARTYAAQRGLAAETIERFRIGYASDSWNDVLRRFGAGEREQAALAAAGLIIERERAQRRQRPLLRPVPRPPDVSDPRYARPRDRLWRPRARQR